MFFRSNPNWSVVDPLRNIGEFLASFPGPAQLSVAISTSVLQATKSWAGPGNEASEFPDVPNVVPDESLVVHLLVPGWRFRKQYYLIVSKTDSKQPKHLLSWVRCCRVECT